MGREFTRHEAKALAQKRLVIIESPHKGRNLVERWLNRRYARRCLKDSLMRGEAPLASHLLHTQVLRESDAYERQLGIGAGLAWLSKANASVFYLDRGMSEGMDLAWWAAKDAGVPIEYRMLNPVPTSKQ
jgi:hypothetical protein